MVASDGSSEVSFDVNESILKHVASLKPWFPKQVIICTGEYLTRILQKPSFEKGTNDRVPVFIGKNGEETANLQQAGLKPDSIFGFDEDVDTHFWFNALQYFTKNDKLTTYLKNKSLDKVREALIVASIWDGVGSAMLPTLVSKLKASNTKVVVFAVLPSATQPPDAQFNAYSALGLCAAENFAPILLMRRDYLDCYVGVDQKGSTITSNAVLDYILEMVLAKQKSFVHEISELAKPFNVRMFAVLSATGASLKIYGSFENVLNAALSKPFSEFDLSRALVAYVLIRVPSQFKSKLAKGKIELAVAKWFETKVKLKGICVSEPTYVEGSSDRVEVVMFVGSLDIAKLFPSIERETSAIKAHAIEQGLMKKADWQVIVKNLGKEEDKPV